MTLLSVLVEGHTEQGFVDELLAPHLASVGVAVRSILIAKPSGGNRSWQRWSREVRRLIGRTDRTKFASTMVDLYGLPSDWPGRTEAAREIDPWRRVHVLERAAFEDIGDPRFLPYVQLHEFEALLFADIDRLKLSYPKDVEAIAVLSAEVRDFVSPEHIDDREMTAPSKRIARAVPRYQKRLAGPVVALDIGLARIRTACPHFGAWLGSLERIATEGLDTGWPTLVTAPPPAPPPELGRGVS